MAELRIQGLSKHFGAHTVLRGIDLTVASGSLVAILGPSGSGKTTLLRLLCGFERADGGSIALNGRIVSSAADHVPPEQRRIGYVPQEGALFPHLSVAENIVFGLPRQERRARHRVQELLELVGLSADYANRPPQQLSGGQQQRVALARALAPSPALVLLDEPFSALDAALRAETREAVADALSAAGATAVLVTHDQSEALSMGHQVAVLWDGRLVQVASPEQLYRQPANPELARFIGDAVLLPGVAGNGQVQCALGTLALMGGMPQGPVQVLLRPEQIRLLPLSGASEARARVLEVIFYGHDACVRLRTGGVSPIELTARVPGHSSPVPGQEVALAIEGSVAAFA
ncbi:ABC transporter ATP-binding protein [Crenobacter sp. SG2303]|uniref:ABC transporter ATP-binding protein n=1 Tax=Crenobacter oryzisoli TaxID=3056844 RepID=A0ABT7XT93_9NEIS|nr:MULTISPECIES: ABC transporter ATP-binding protein [unclassified Crenobacter]MDN0076993.1 ABC transporter ATP-binding protein [Crenobacter sp. SG2303]MDN0085171.1 ABC transporter ATP-binding protein [Crenobacter sp. SG2305]